MSSFDPDSLSPGRRAQYEIGLGSNTNQATRNTNDNLNTQEANALKSREINNKRNNDAALNDISRNRSSDGTTRSINNSGVTQTNAIKKPTSSIGLGSSVTQTSPSVVGLGL